MDMIGSEGVGTGVSAKSDLRRNQRGWESKAWGTVARVSSRGKRRNIEWSNFGGERGLGAANGGDGDSKREEFTGSAYSTRSFGVQPCRYSVIYSCFIAI